VYDPDPPYFQNATVVSAPVAGSTLIEWNATDPDAGEMLRYTLSVRSIEEENWTQVASDIVTNSYDLDVSDLPDGQYMVRITAIDSSSFGLVVDTVVGPITVDNPQSPVVTLLEPVEGFEGRIDDQTLTGTLLTVKWTAEDQDGGRLEYSIHYKVDKSVAWVPIAEGLTGSEYIWNVSSMADGKYYLKVTAVDPTGLSGSSSTGLFTLQKPEPAKPPVEDPDKDNKRTNATDEIDLSGLAIAGGISLLVVLFVAVIVVIALSASRRKKKQTAVVPTEEEVDLEVPEFDRQGSTLYSGVIPEQPVDTVSETEEPGEVLVSDEEIPDHENPGGQ
jgi:hypothetical protein